MKKGNLLKIIFLFSILIFSFFLIYNRVFFKGEVIIPGDIPYNTPIWQGEAPDKRYYKADNYLLSDQINQFYVWHKIASQSIKETGRIPLWNPFIFGGQPLVANSQSALFYPPNLLLFFCEPGTVATIRIFFNIIIIGIFGFLLGLQLGISKVGSFLISAGFVFSGPVTVWSGHPHANVFVWFPFLMWSGEKLIFSNRKFLWTGIVALGIGISILGGHPETVFHMFLVVSIYFLFRLLFLKRGRVNKKRSIIFLLIAMITGIVIGSIQLVPFSDFLFKSSTLREGGRGVRDGSLLWSNSFKGNLSELPTLVFPNFYGNPVDRTYNNPLNNKSNYNEQSIYFGLIPLSFFLILLLRKKKSIQEMLFVSISLVSLAVALRAPLFELFNHLPVLSLVANGRLRIFFTFFAIVSAGFGFDIFKKYFVKQRDTLYKLLIFPGVAIAIFVSFSAYKSIEIFIGNNSQNVVFANVSFMKYLAFKIFLFSDFKTMITVISSFLIILLVYFLVKGTIKLKTFELLILILCIVDLAVPALGYNPTIKNSDILPKPSVFSEFSESDMPFRVICDDSIRLQNYNAVHKVQLMGGYDLPVFGRYGDLFLSQNKGDIHNHIWREDSELIDFLNVKYYFNKGNQPPLSGKYKLIFNNLNYRLYENTDSFPRAFMVYDYKVITKKGDILKYLEENDFKLKDKVILNQPLRGDFKRFPYSSDVSNNVKFLYYGNDRIDLNVKTDTKGILVLSDIFMPGWKVYVDEKPGVINQANFTFRSVVIPKGTHSVSFKYKPLSFTLGIWMSFIGMVFTFLFFFFDYRIR